MQVVGRDGGDLQTLWGERPYALLGITVHGFPNFFCMYGPGANSRTGGSLIWHSECQIRYITSALDQLIGGGYRAMETLQHRCEEWYRQSRAEIKNWSGRNRR